VRCRADSVDRARPDRQRFTDRISPTNGMAADLAFVQSPARVGRVASARPPCSPDRAGHRVAHNRSCRVVFHRVSLRLIRAVSAVNPEGLAPLPGTTRHGAVVRTTSSIGRAAWRRRCRADPKAMEKPTRRDGVDTRGPAAMADVYWMARRSGLTAGPLWARRLRRSTFVGQSSRRPLPIPRLSCRSMIIHGRAGVYPGKQRAGRQIAGE
jgi:hypothetical protein